MKIGLILAAAGTGQRAGAKLPKQFQKIKGVPLLAYSLDKFAQVKGISETAIAVPRGKETFARKLLASTIKKFPQTIFVAGGKTRQQSVFNALLKLSDSISHVLVHDAARPFVNPEDILRLLRMLRANDAVILASPATDTIKWAKRGRILKTLNRGEIYLAETPQGFKKSLLLAAHRRARKNRFAFSDDSALVEQLGRRVTICPSDGKNLKVTTPNDLALAKLLLSKGKGLAG